MSTPAERPPFAEADLPALHRAAGRLSATAQQEHLRGNQLLLALLLAGASFSALTPAAELLSGLVPAQTEGASGSPAIVHHTQQALALLAAIALSGGLWLTALLRTTRRAEAWYDGRALAESSKSMAWKYMMGAAPYGLELDAAAVDAVFCADLVRLLKDLSGHALPGADPDDGAQITPRMRQVRSLSVSSRLAVYLSARLEDQQRWYARRSSEHTTASRWWFRASLVINTLALVLALVTMLWAPASSLLGVATTAASCAIAWAQLQRYADLAHAYGITSHEIGLLGPQSNEIQTSEALARFVADCETAFSREHTMWRARREITDS